MSRLRKLFIYAFVFSFIAFAASCAEESAPVDDQEEVIEVGGEDELVEDKVYHQVPTPHEMMEFIKANGKEFRPELLCATDISGRYVDMKGKSMGIGIFIADLAYTASYSQFQESIKYFNVIVGMSEEIGISNVFDESMMERIKNNLDHSDSLEAISNESYYNIIAELENDDRGKIVGMMAAGGFLESLFISLQMIDKFDANDPMMQRIAGQKLIYENIMAYLEKYKDDQNVEWTIMDMTALKASFDDISDTRKDTKFSEGAGGKKVLGGTGGIYITEDEFEELRFQATNLRNLITFNSQLPQ